MGAQERTTARDQVHTADNDFLALAEVVANAKMRSKSSRGSLSSGSFAGTGFTGQTNDIVVKEALAAQPPPHSEPSRLIHSCAKGTNPEITRKGPIEYTGSVSSQMERRKNRKQDVKTLRASVIKGLKKTIEANRGGDE